ncbi:cell wall hydrolase [Devosia sp. FKR38]|uniref:cell wall hydrolase n=1 Tax=Devosia sp. FKR38 TaxID=2562312 RepID=UPI0010C0DB85|nr:cell wall hydrolase [Devosia sp. FKR38]
MTDGLTSKDGALTQTWQLKAVRALAHLLALCAVSLVLFITLAPAQAQTIQVASVTPMPVPADLLAVRQQPAIGPTVVPLAPGEQALTPALLSNYVARQQQLRSVNVDSIGPQAPLNTDVLLGYIARGPFGTNSAISAIADVASAKVTAEPALNSSALADYIQHGYQPLEQRLAHANAERDCLAQAIYHEARGESAAGQLAVANVIVNRARSAKFPSTLCGVIYQNADKGFHRCQFTFACDGRTDAPAERRAWARSAELAQTVYAEFATGEAVGAIPRSALYYHTTNVRPNWANTYNAVAQIGSHIFYAPN